MTIQPVEFVHSSDAEGKRMNTVRLRGTRQVHTFELVTHSSLPDHRLSPDDRIIGWLGIELVMAEPRDVQGAKFDLVGIAAPASSDPQQT